MPSAHFLSFNLKSLLMLVTLLSCAMAVLTALHRDHWQRQQVINHVDSLGGFTRFADQNVKSNWFHWWDPDPTFAERILGPDSVRVPLIVDLKDTRAEDADVRRLLVLSTIERLDLAGTNITDAAIDDIARMPNVKLVSVWETKATQAGREKLLRLRPDIELCAFRWVSCIRDFELMHIPFPEDEWAAGNRLCPFEKGGF